MPGYNCSLKGLLNMIGKEEVNLENLEDYLDAVKSELKEYDSETDELKLENNDTNRPDLWSLEGTARQIKACMFDEHTDYDFFDKTPKTENVIKVDPNLKGIRPYIAGFSVSGTKVTDELLKQLIQAQEKLCDNFGRKRELIAIGIYDFNKVKLPVHYVASEKTKSFMPLGFEEEMTLSEILEKHPKGIQYGNIVAKFDKFPLLTDDSGEVMSFPPVINSNNLGKVKVGDENLFVEVTGTEKESVMLVANIMAVNIADHGGIIEPFTIEYESEKFVSPSKFEDSTEVTLDFTKKLTGLDVTIDELENSLRKFGHVVKRIDENTLSCTPPSYRRDILHMSDLVEDYCICYGYNNFVPKMLDSFTVGSESDISKLEKLMRELLIGMNFQEVMTYILTSKENQTVKMRDESGIAEIANPMTETYGVVRKSIIPILLEIESKNPRAEYPHRIFEIGEVASADEKTSYETKHKLSVLVAHSNANFSEISSILQALMYYLGREYKLEPIEHPSYIVGRTGAIIYKGENIGVIGEIHPEVLENWSIGMPCCGFELDIK